MSFEDTRNNLKASEKDLQSLSANEEECNASICSKDLLAIEEDEDSRLSVKDNKSDSEQFSNTSVESVSMVEAVQSSRSQRNEATAQRKVSINKNKITVCISNQKEEEKLLERKKTSMQTARNMILFHLGIKNYVCTAPKAKFSNKIKCN